MSSIIEAVAPKVTGAKRIRQQQHIARLAPVWDQIATVHGIVTPLRRAHFVAQTCHETDGFCAMVEYASGARYEGRKDLGNIHPGDGRRFRGRGLPMLTGRANYSRYGAKIGVDLLGDPDRAADPVTSLLVYCAYWLDKDLNPWADADNLRVITKRINGGYNGLEDRQRYLNAAKEYLGAQPRDHLTWSAWAWENTERWIGPLGSGIY